MTRRPDNKRRNSIHVKRSYLMRTSAKRAENHKRKVKHRGGIHQFRQEGDCCINAIAWHHHNRVIHRRMGI